MSVQRTVTNTEAIQTTRDTEEEWLGNVEREKELAKAWQLLQRLPFNERATVRLRIVRGIELVHLGLTKYRFNKIIRRLQIMARVERTCAACGETKPVGSFYAADTPDVAIKSVCMACGATGRKKPLLPKTRDIWCSECGTRVTVKRTSKRIYTCSKECATSRSVKMRPLKMPPRKKSEITKNP